MSTLPGLFGKTSRTLLKTPYISLNTFFNLAYTYVISDTHFDGLMYTETPKYVDIILDNWRSTITPEDTIIHVGDVMGGRFNRQWSSTISDLPGHKILVRGNHDCSKREKWEAAFDEVYDKTYQSGNILYCHYPKNPLEYGCQYNIYGHLHYYPQNYQDGYVRHYRKFFSFQRNFCYSIRDWNYMPVKEDEFVNACLSFARDRGLD